MPEDISREPHSYTAIKDTPSPAFTVNIAKKAMDNVKNGGEAREEIPHSEILEFIPKITKVLEKRYPDLSPDIIKEFQNLYFGIHSLNSDDLNRDTWKGEDMRVRSAQIQIARARAIFYAALGEGGPEYAKKVLDSVAAHYAIAKSKETSAIVYDTGINVFLGISKFFYRKGFDVFGPDSTGDGQEVREWDVKRGIDGCAVKLIDDEPLFILFDAKGQRNYPKDDPRGRVGIRKEVDVTYKRLDKRDISRLPLSLQGLIGFDDAEESEPSVYKSMIMIPTDFEELVDFHDAYKKMHDKGPVAVLGELGQVSLRVYGALNQRIDRIIDDDKGYRERRLKK